MDSDSSPPCMRLDDYAAAEPARKRLAQKQSRLFASLQNLRKSSSAQSSRPKPKRKKGNQRERSSSRDNDSPAHSDRLPEPINLSGITTDEGDEQDEYRWAILYENQRGATVFSIPYYSSLSLLPTDPTAFTVPSAYTERSQQPNVSLNSYPLPDGTWRWVSKTWMVDMRTDSGEVQHDGFEYNWTFRKGKWRSEVGVLGAGGLVRRRRWVRLMMRPAKLRRTVPEMDQPALAVDGSLTVQDHPSWVESIMDGHTASVSSSQSVMTRASETLDESPDAGADDVWQGRDVEQDWARCHALMKRVGRDGRKLELWRKWLRAYLTESDLPTGKNKGKQRQKQWTEDDTPQSSEVSSILSNVIPDVPPPVLEHIAGVVRAHGDFILRLFIFPESRAQFIKLLDRAGLIHELRANCVIKLSTSEVDFWSYMNGLDVVHEVVKEHEEEHCDQEKMEDDGDKGLLGS